MKDSFSLAAEVIKKYEGCRLEAYRDPVGIVTIGYGHTGKAAFEGHCITEEEAERLLKDDMADAILAVHRFVKVDINEYQKAALISFVFNVGAGKFNSSTMLRRINEKEFDLAANEFDRWIYAGGKVLRGLVNRRRAEKELFIKGGEENAEVDYVDT